MHLLSNQPSYLDPSDSNTPLILFQRYLHSLYSVKAVLCSKKRTDDYLWVINKVHVQTLRSSYLH